MSGEKVAVPPGGRWRGLTPMSYCILASSRVHGRHLKVLNKLLFRSLEASSNERNKLKPPGEISRRGRKNGHSWTGRHGAGLKHSLYRDGRNSINIIDQCSGLDSFPHEYVEENGCCFDPLASTPPQFDINKSGLDLVELWKP